MDVSRRTSLIFALLIVGLAFTSTAPAVLTPMIYTESFELRIPAKNSGNAWMNEAVINVPDNFAVVDLDVHIKLTHARASDLELILMAPDETRLRLNWYGQSGSPPEGQDYNNTEFDDGASVGIEMATPPFVGRFKPKAPSQLAVFNDMDAFGPWRLQIYDWKALDTGVFGELTLAFNTPEPATISLLLLGTALAKFRKPRKRN